MDARDAAQTITLQIIVRAVFGIKTISVAASTFTWLRR